MDASSSRRDARIGMKLPCSGPSRGLFFAGCTKADTGASGNSGGSGPTGNTGIAGPSGSTGSTATGPGG
jgi:hypothetical protein